MEELVLGDGECGEREWVDGAGVRWVVSMYPKPCCSLLSLSLSGRDWNFLLYFSRKDLICGGIL